MINKNEWEYILVRNSHFICPICGGSYFGSSTNDDGTLTRNCHGTLCGYSWHENDDGCHLFISWDDIKSDIRDKAILRFP